MLHVRELGRPGAPPVLLLHGSPVPAQHLEPLASALSATHRVLLPDLPGYGGSPALGESLGDAQAELEAHLEAHALTAIDLVGIGLGAYRAFQLALGGVVRPRRIATLSGFAGLSADEQRRCLTWADILRAGGDLCDLVIRLAMSAEQRDGDPALVERLRLWIHQVPVATWSAELAAMSRIGNLAAQLGAVRATVLALHGVHDAFVAPTKVDEIAGAAPRVIRELVPCGHLALDELPERVIPRVRGFLLA